ncbi:type III pantothenate kinase [Simiduia sp. 21SJ11W-1]|uniref:type III pantothenate kinase n=1 Tax=Simiduia sp. 21SJ11W-1 TaxID=2909669 RepID=UPI00209DD08F|nr:type III pantothenate kinase [Simiduia sp. 21SJ11W-1]UTA47438.1 type III pantothenate kinase [Simiduia sp. 21SJ11W-1]
MIVDVDCGNTRIKWRLAGQVQSHAVSWQEFEAAGCQILSLPKEGVRRIRLASVASKSAQLQAALGAAFGVEVERAIVQSGSAGLECGYLKPSTLGVDRWLAALAAHHHWPGKPLLIVDAGTALTVDVVQGGRFEGGFIGPGLGMMRAALYGGTAAVKVASLQAGMPASPGSSTEAAVSGALLLMAVGLVKEAQSRFAAGAQLVFTGGDGRALQAAFAGADYVPDLVLDGLAVALP